MIDIILPIYNETSNVETYFNSINIQKKYINQVIIINDCSVDNSPNILYNLFKNNNIKVKIIENLKNVGPILSIKRAMEHVEADYVSLSSCNDLILDGMYAAALSDFEIYPNAGIWTAMVEDRYGNKTNVSHIMLPHHNMIYLTKDKALNNLYKFGPWFEGATLIFKVSKLTNSEFYFFNEKLGAYADTFTAICISIIHGAIFRPEILAINIVNNKSYGLSFFSNINNLEILKKELKSLNKILNIKPFIFNRLIKRLTFTFKNNDIVKIRKNKILNLLKYRYFDLHQIILRYFLLMNLLKIRFWIKKYE